MFYLFSDWFNDILEFVQANGYKDFMTYFMIITIGLAFAIYLFQYIRNEIKNDEDY